MVDDWGFLQKILCQRTYLAKVSPALSSVISTHRSGFESASNPLLDIKYVSIADYHMPKPVSKDRPWKW